VFNKFQIFIKILVGD